MELVVTSHKGFTVAEVRGVVLPKETLPELVELVETRLAAGERTFAILFADQPFLHSGAIGSLVRAIETVNDQEGTIVLVTPSRQMLELINLFQFRRAVRVCASLEELDESGDGPQN